MKTEKFNLTWKDFENCTSNSFRGFMSRQEFVDVTLMCDDSNQIRAHKVLLSACSEFFKNILVKTSHQQHTVMYIDSVTHQELQNIISFMYFGETTITQEEFTNFMRAAQKLQIKGLSEQYCKQVPPSNNTAKHLKRSPQQGKYKTAMEKGEPFEPVKYLNVVDALSKSMECVEDCENGTEEDYDKQVIDNSLFVDVELNEVTETDDVNEDPEEVSEGVDDNVEEVDDEQQVDMLNSEVSESEDVENVDDDHHQVDILEDDDDDDQMDPPESEDEEGDEYLPNENEEFSESGSESDDDDCSQDFEDRLEIENIMEHVDENDDDVFTHDEIPTKMEIVDGNIKLESETPIKETEDTLRNTFPARLRRRKRYTRNKNVKRESEDYDV